jgi:hypothetical protein
MRDVANPTRDPAVQELVRRIRRAYAARAERPASKTALTKDPLEAMLATCKIRFCLQAGRRSTRKVPMTMTECTTKCPNPRSNNSKGANPCARSLRTLSPR